MTGGLEHPAGRPGDEPRPAWSPAATTAAEMEVFDEEIRSAIRYERGLAVKAVVALAIVALVVLIRLLFLS